MIDVEVSESREAFWLDLLARFGRRVLAYAQTTRCSVGEAEEIAADVWATAVVFEASLAVSEDQWSILQPLIRSLCARRMRVWRREQAWATGRLEQVEAPTANDQSMYHVALWRWWEHASASLSDQQRSAIDLRYRWGWSFPDVAEALDVAEPTARVHVLRGLEKLRQFCSVHPPPAN